MTTWYDSIKSSIETLNPFKTTTLPTYAELTADAKNLSDGMSAFTDFQVQLSNTAQVIKNNTCIQDANKPLDATATEAQKKANANVAPAIVAFDALYLATNAFIADPANYTSTKIISGLATLQTQLTVIQNKLKLQCAPLDFTAATVSTLSSTDTCAGVDSNGNQVTREMMDSETFSLNHMFEVSRETIKWMMIFIVFVGFALWGGSTASNAAINKSPILRFYYFIYGTLLFPFSLGTAYMRYSSGTSQKDNTSLLQPLCEPFKYYAILAPLIKKSKDPFTTIAGFFFTLFYPLLYPFIYEMPTDDCFVTPEEVTSSATARGDASAAAVKTAQAAAAQAAAAQAAQAAAAQAAAQAAGPTGPSTSSTKTSSTGSSTGTHSGGFYQSRISRNAMMA